MAASKSIVYDTVWLKEMASQVPEVETKAIILSSYQKLKAKLKACEKKLYWAQVEIADADLSLDKLDAPKSKEANIGHRLFWFSEGKRESFKNRKNTDGYPPDVHKQIMQDLEDLRTPPPAVEKKKTYSHKMNILKDGL